MSNPPALLLPNSDAERLRKLIEAALRAGLDCSGLERRLAECPEVQSDPAEDDDGRGRRALARAHAARRSSEKLIASSKALVIGSRLRIRSEGLF